MRQTKHKCPKCGDSLKAIEHESLYVASCTYFTVKCSSCKYRRLKETFSARQIKEMGITEIQYLQ